MANTVRAFIAIELPETVVSSIEAIQSRLKSLGMPMRWVQPENMHLTVKFLGDIEAHQVGHIDTALQDSARGLAPFTVSVKGVGVFPNIRRPRVVWVGIDDHSTGLKTLHRSIDEKLQLLGFEAEKRPYSGHLTLGRVKGTMNGKRLQDALDPYARFQSDPFSVTGFYLFRSVLKPTGPEYGKLVHISLTN